MKPRRTAWIPLASILACLPLGDFATAAVVQVDQVVRVGPGSATVSSNEYDLDVNGDGVDDVNFHYSYGITGGRPFPPTYVSTRGLNGAEVAVVPTAQPRGLWLDAHFGPGESVGPAASFEDFGQLTTFSNEISGYNGPWGFQNGPHFLGVRIPDGTDMHYGWVRLSHDPSPGATPSGPILGPLILTAWAYETQPGVAITTVPEPGATTFALVALASAALRRKRRRHGRAAI